MNFLTKSTFSDKVETTARSKNLSYIEAVIEICKEAEIEPEDSKKFISNILRDKIEAEAMNLNFLPRRHTLSL